jgi:hypothetical protein
LALRLVWRLACASAPFSEATIAALGRDFGEAEGRVGKVKSIVGLAVESG